MGSGIPRKPDSAGLDMAVLPIGRRAKSLESFPHNASQLSGRQPLRLKDADYFSLRVPLAVHWRTNCQNAREVNRLRNRQALRLQQLESMKRCYGAGCAEPCEHVLAELKGAKPPDVESLIRFHDTLLFLRAFPQSAKVVELADLLLTALAPQVATFVDSPSAVVAFDDESVSGIVGTTVNNTWTYELARWLVERHARAIRAEWNVDEQYRHMATILPNCMPLLEDDSSVEADTPYLKWMTAAAGGEGKELAWLLQSFSKVPVSPLDRTSLYDALGVNLAWNLSESSASRTLARRSVSQFFFHDAPLLQRKHVSLADEMASPPLKLRKLSQAESGKIIDMARDALAVRYRELHGSTHADSSYVFEANVGRGVQLFIWGLDAEWRLPLRAYYAGFTLKNGVPVNYFEAIGLFEWIEVGFNTFYAFREGETAWIYSKVLHLLHQLAGVTCISVYPYQIGQDNEEAIQSGAFWFYRKLGFRPGRQDLLAITEREETKIARDPKHRTSPRTLRKLAEGHMFFEFGDSPGGRWDSFSVRALGLVVQRKMAAEFGGDAVKMRRATTKALARILDVNLATWNLREQQAFGNFALVLALVPGVARWPSEDKRSLAAIVRAKAGLNETGYLQQLLQHSTLRDALLRIGSTTPESEAATFEIG